MAGMTWLHLSDWHQGSEAFDQYQESGAFDRQVVSKRLREDIVNRTRISTDLAKIDFFIFSGDVAFSGRESEYQAAIEQLFTPVLAATGLDKDRLFIIPGNHDIDQKKFKFLPVELTRPFSSDAQVKAWLKEDNREYILAPFKAYDQFINKYTNQKHSTYASVYDLVIDDKKVALLGLNSALMCGRNKIVSDGKEKVNDYGYLVVGEPQLFDGLKQIDDADISIAVLHHSFEWLQEFERMQIKEQLGENFHFILCGHEHAPQVNMIQGTTGHCLMIPAGAGFDKRVPADPIYTNAYNFVHLNFDTGKVTIYLRRWNNRKPKWENDTSYYPNGQFTFDLPKLLSKTFPAIVPPTAAISDPTTYPLTDEQKQTAGPLKQDTTSDSKQQVSQTQSDTNIDTQQPFSSPKGVFQQGETAQISRNDLLQDLANTTPGVFQMVVSFLEIPPSNLSGGAAPPSIRAEEILTVVGNENLQKVKDALYWAKHGKKKM